MPAETFNNVNETSPGVEDMVEFSIEISFHINYRTAGGKLEKPKYYKLYVPYSKMLTYCEIFPLVALAMYIT